MLWRETMNMRNWLLLASFTVLPFQIAVADEYNGKLNWFNPTELSLAQSGVVTKVNVVAGQMVNKGDRLIELDPSVFNANYKFRTAQKRQALMLMEEAERELVRSKELYERTLISEHDLVLAEAAFIKEQSNQLQIEAEYQLAKQQLAQSQVIAPFEARILQVKVQPHQFINTQVENRTVVVIADSQYFGVESMVRASEAKKFKLNSAVNVKIGTDTVAGKVVAIAMEPEAELNMARITVSIPYKTSYFPGKSAVIMP